MPTEASPAARYWAPRAWLDDGSRQGWHEQVLLEVGADGCWARLDAGIATPPEGATVLAGAVLPGLVDAHSHAFQRAFAGLSERREAIAEGPADTFWSWRDRMYDVALRITPAQLRAVATHLYVELLRGGYTQVCEFHYLHRAPDGQAYDDPWTMCWALADAARSAGIGLTLLPTLYEHAGFDAPALRPDQRRFAIDAAGVWAASAAIDAASRPGLSAGVALHSLRAASPASIATLRELAGGSDGPIHIHVAEQPQEVADCLAATGLRPIEWLAAQGLLDARWHLVHATHTTPAEIDAIAARGAGVVLCPSTEANLGDGLPDLGRMLDAGVPLSIGSDSHIGRAWPEELRWLEYGQRLLRQQRNLSASPNGGWPSTAERLWSTMLRGGAAAAGFSRWGLQPGARADALVLPPGDAARRGIPPRHTLDALVFSSPTLAWRDVMVGGRWVLRDDRAVHGDERIERDFEAAMQALWSDDPT